MGVPITSCTFTNNTQLLVAEGLAMRRALSLTAGILLTVGIFAGRAGGTLPGAPRFVADTLNQEDTMGRGLLLWLIGIPIPIILIIWLLGGLHG